MNEFRRNRVVLYALGASVALHSIVAFVAHTTPVVVAKEQPPEHVRIFRITKPRETPRPPTPRKVVASVSRKPSAARAHAPAINPVNVPGSPDPSERNGGTYQPGPFPGAVTDGQTTALPSPTDTPKPACSVPNVAASTVEPITPTVPEDAAGETGTAQIRVTISATGAVVGVEIYRPTGSFLLDRAALAAARASTYRPEIRDCVPVGGSYLFTAEFR